MRSLGHHFDFDLSVLLTSKASHSMESLKCDHIFTLTLTFTAISLPFQPLPLNFTPFPPTSLYLLERTFMFVADFWILLSQSLLVVFCLLICLPMLVQVSCQDIFDNRPTTSISISRSAENPHLERV